MTSLRAGDTYAVLVGAAVAGAEGLFGLAGGSAYS